MTGLMNKQQNKPQIRIYVQGNKKILEFYAPVFRLNQSFIVVVPRQLIAMYPSYLQRRRLVKFNIILGSDNPNSDKGSAGNFVDNKVVLQKPVEPIQKNGNTNPVG